MSIPPKTPTLFQAFVNILGLNPIGAIELFLVTASAREPFVNGSSQHPATLQPLATIQFECRTKPAVPSRVAPTPSPPWTAPAAGSSKGP